MHINDKESQIGYMSAQRVTEKSVGNCTAPMLATEVWLMTRIAKACSYIILILALPICIHAQTATYHLHNEFSTEFGIFYYMKTTGPDQASVARLSPNLKGAAPGEYNITDWKTLLGVPNAAGIIPAGSSVTFSLWMRKTSSNSGTMFPLAKLSLASSGSLTLICTATHTRALDTTLFQYSLSAVTSTPISVTTSDRFFLSVGVNVTQSPGSKNVQAEIDIEGTLNGNYDSQIVVPLPTTPPPVPTINNISPSSGPIGTSVTVSGANFGTTQGSSTITFNGAAASPTSWTSGSIVAPVPSGATTGPVIVTVGGVVSNGITFTVLTTGSIAGTVSRVSGGTPIVGALIEALQSGLVVASATTGAGGTYTLPGLVAGTYDVRAAASDFVSQVQTGITVTSGSSTTANFSLANDPSIKYVYDGLGRLVGVIDPAGDTAIYAYDAVGNLLSISRYNSSSVSIIEFTPHSGISGASVTIFGTGFSPTPDENTVRFNGVVASVQSASSTQIKAVVPSAASTGPITITTPGGSATSSTPFTVDSATGLPSISGFSPTIGTPGTAVTITGANFDVTNANNRVKFNLPIARIGSSTATLISAFVPAAGTSGRISIATPLGQAVSTGDFFVPPTPYTASDVAVTSRMVLGESKTVTISTANKIGLIVFDGSAGQSISLNITGVTVSDCDLFIKKPDGATLVSTYANTSGAFIDATALPTTGTYTILVDPRFASTGSLTLSLYNIVDLSGTISIGGPPVSVAIPTPGQNGRLTFSGSAGQRVALQASGVTIFIGGMIVFNPDNSVASSSGLLSNPGDPTHVNFTDWTLAATGTYTVFINPDANYTGSLTLTLYEPPADVSGTITPGFSVNQSIGTPGQRARLTFNGTAGQRVSVRTTIVPSSFNVDVLITILNPDGSAFANSGSRWWTGFLDTQVLPATGTFTILLDPGSAVTGTLTTTLYDVPPDASSTGTLNGPTVNLSISTPGQNAHLTFNATTGQKVAIQTNSGLPNFWWDNGLRMSVKAPDGQFIISLAAVSPGTRVDTITVPLTGTYTVDYEGTDYATGGISVNLSIVPPDINGSIVINGTAVTVTTTAPTQNAALTFTGNAGQRVSLNISSVTITSSIVSITSPASQTLVSVTVGTAGSFIEPVTLPTAGTYTILIDPQDQYTGSMTLTLYDVPADVSGALSINGSSVGVSITARGQNARLTFSGTSGQQVTVKLTGNNIDSVTVSLLSTSGSTLTSSTSSSHNFNLASQTLSASGTYTVLVNPPGTNLGSISVKVTSP